MSFSLLPAAACASLPPTNKLLRSIGHSRIAPQKYGRLAAPAQEKVTFATMLGI
jgi:hypothetical protein